MIKVQTVGDSKVLSWKDEELIVDKKDQKFVSDGFGVEEKQFDQFLEIAKNIIREDKTNNKVEKLIVVIDKIQPKNLSELLLVAYMLGGIEVRLVSEEAKEVKRLLLKLLLDN